MAFASCYGSNKLIEGCCSAADVVVTPRLLHSLKAQIKLRKHSYFTACVVSGTPWFLVRLVHYLSAARCREFTDCRICAVSERRTKSPLGLLPDDLRDPPVTLKYTEEGCMHKVGASKLWK